MGEGGSSGWNKDDSGKPRAGPILLSQPGHDTSWSPHRPCRWPSHCRSEGCGLESQEECHTCRGEVEPVHQGKDCVSHLGSQARLPGGRQPWVGH